jgi:hypothetical protein
MRRLGPIILAVAAAGATALAFWPESRAAVPRAVAKLPSVRASTVQTPAIDDSTFAALITGLSERGRYFDTDNLISNESSYLHVIDGLRERDVRGGAYIGVGPDQNFSYMAAIRPRIAFIIDIRRDNLIQHVLFKTLFEMAPTRIEFVSLLFGRTPPPDPAEWTDRSIAGLLAYIDEAPVDADYARALQRRLVEHAQATGVPLSADDLATLVRIHTTFMNAGPDLRYSSHGRAPRPSYPTYRQLLNATDRDGDQASFLADEEDYAFLRTLEQNNLVIPVVGDFAGPHALRAVGGYIRDTGMIVSAFYLSNVEFYLWQDGIFDRFAHSVATLPYDRRTTMIRSLFGRVYAHPRSLPGFNSTQLMQDMAGFVSGFESGQYETYGDLVYRGYIGR